VAEGTGNYIFKLKPATLKPMSAKELVLKDVDYSTPADHLFEYTTKRQSEGFSDSEKHSEILKDLDFNEKDLTNTLTALQKDRVSNPVEAYMISLTP